MKAKRLIKRDARRLLRLCYIDGLLDDGRIVQVAAAIGKARGRDRLPLLEEFRRRVALADARRTATIQSALPLSSEMQAALRSDLERLYGRGLLPTFSDQPALIGGMRIRVGNNVYDGSVQGRLASLEQRF